MLSTYFKSNTANIDYGKYTVLLHNFVLNPCIFYRDN